MLVGGRAALGSGTDSLIGVRVLADVDLDQGYPLELDEMLLVWLAGKMSSHLEPFPLRQSRTQTMKRHATTGKKAHEEKELGLIGVAWRK